MVDILTWVLSAGLVLNTILLIVLTWRVFAGPRQVEDLVRGEFRAARDDADKSARGLRGELSDGLKVTHEMLSTSLASMASLQQAQLDSMAKQLKEVAEANQQSLDRIRTTFDSRVKELQEGNEKKLEEMRKTVDEKLHETLEKRLGESFKLVGDRLEAVQKGLGEMQSLAIGVGDLRRVLTNVKTRGMLAEVQLGSILEQILAPGQYERNVRIRTDSAESVEFAVRFPGPKGDLESTVWLPIDSKFPQDDYVRLQEAAEKGDQDSVQKASDSLMRAIRSGAKDIHDKYIRPPDTTDMAIMFVATEGLYSEVHRHPSIVDELHQRYHVVVCGPSTLAAFLSSLRMGFQTLAIEQRAAEVWRVLGAVKTEFAKFGEVLDKVGRQLNGASRTIEETGVRSRAIERRLRSVEQLPIADATEMLAVQDGEPEDLQADEFDENDDLPF